MRLGFQNQKYPTPDSGPSDGDMVFLAGFDAVDWDTDESTNAATITFAGAAGVTTDQAKFGDRSLRVGATSDDFAHFPNIADYALSGQWTLSGFYYRNGGGAFRQTLISYSGHGAGNNKGWAVLLNDSNNSFDFGFRYSTNGSTATYNYASGQVTDDAHNDAGWHHFHIENDAVNCKGWLDGDEIFSEAAITGIFDPDTDANLSFGTIGDAKASNDYFNGWLDEVYIARSALGLGGTVPTLPVTRT